MLDNNLKIKKASNCFSVFCPISYVVVYMYIAKPAN